MALTADQLYRARLRLGDTETPYLLPDAAYNAVLTDPTISPNEGLAQLAEAIGVSLSQSSGAELTLGDQKYKETSGDNSQRYFDLARTLRARDPGSVQVPKVGLLSAGEQDRHNGGFYVAVQPARTWPY